VAVKAEKNPAFRAVVKAAANHSPARVARSRQQKIHKEKHALLKLKLKVNRQSETAET
jgi:hypothetical protein